ncbi:MAG: hypothetical protein OEQ30_01200 [Gammaproteobacteria bacterium]|jgi:hypothetical protein|nr:hypothetical protein [Gammaproteobacteria bacterium]MDH3757457.1 hypothetical protein [Gammaproteobacteria bacterium]MDH3908966.1 hypothetical protein [Gammaproteobacteria bacterium]MDH4005230.1 hypothetical protein [Gammaproteobacteria bacterium]NCF59129.1 hypothetical protein [Gammaproteobacteria bacterium]
MLDGNTRDDGTPGGFGGCLYARPADRDVADRADYAFGNYRYFPGRGRELFVEFRYVY